MNEQSIRNAFDHIDATPDVEFRKRLRRQLVDGYTAARPISPNVTVKEDIMLQKNTTPNRRFRPRFVVGIAAAAVLIALPVAFALLHDSPDRIPPPVATQPVPTPATLPPSAPLVDEDLAQRALLAPEALGNYTYATDFADAEAYDTEWLVRTATLPECSGIAPSAGFLANPNTAWFVNSNSYSLRAWQSVAVFADVAAADAAMDAIEQPGFVECASAYEDTFSSFPAPDGLTPPEVTSMNTVSYEVSGVRPHGDRQISFGLRTTYNYGNNNSRDTYWVVSYVQVGRAVTLLQVNPDARGVDADNGVVERSLVAAEAALRAALSETSE